MQTVRIGPLLKWQCRRVRQRISSEGHVEQLGCDAGLQIGTGQERFYKIDKL